METAKNKPYIIAETAYCFEGDVNYLLRQTQNLPENIDAIKYHMLFNPSNYMRNDHSLYHLVNNFIIKKSDWEKILKLAHSRSIDVVVLADDEESIDYLSSVPAMVSGIEIHAACVNDKNLLDKAIMFAIKYHKKFYIGISGFEIQELYDIVEYIKHNGLTDIVLMYGFQNYPTKLEDVNLSKIPVISNLFGLPVGYADHTKFDDKNKIHIISTSFAIGANIQEIHYIINEGERRTDFITAVSANRLHDISQILLMQNQVIGSVDFRLNQGEKKYLNIRKIPVFIDNFNIGHVINKGDICFIRVENPSINHIFSDEINFYGRTLKNDVKKFDEVVCDLFY